MLRAHGRRTHKTLEASKKAVSNVDFSIIVLNYVMDMCVFLVEYADFPAMHMISMIL